MNPSNKIPQFSASETKKDDPISSYEIMHQATEGMDNEHWEDCITEFIVQINGGFIFTFNEARFLTDELRVVARLFKEISELQVSDRGGELGREKLLQLRSDIDKITYTGKENIENKQAILEEVRNKLNRIAAQFVKSNSRDKSYDL